MSNRRPSRLWTDEELDRWWDNRSREEQEQAIRAYDRSSVDESLMAPPSDPRRPTNGVFSDYQKERTMDAELEQAAYDAEEDKALNADIERYHEYQRRHEAPTVYADPTPEKLPFQLRVHYPHSSEHGQAASWDHILAAVRRGVESGTIKGEVAEGYEDDAGYWALAIDEPGTYIVIGPVSDGGSET